MNSVSGYDKWLTTPPDDDPICEDGCGETLVRDAWTHEWICVNKFCPTKFQGVEQEMANTLVDALEEIRTLKAKIVRMKREYDTLVEAISNSGLE